MRLILIFLLLNLTACSLIGTNTNSEEDTSEVETDTSISLVPFINLAIKMLPETYRLEVQQGNEINADMLMKLKPDMTTSQVKFILGTPLIQDSFHKDRWDYVYVMRKEGKVIESRHVVLLFKNELLSEIKGDVIESNNKVGLEDDEATVRFDSEALPREDTVNNDTVKEKVTFGESATGSTKIVQENKELMIKNKELNPVISSSDSAGNVVRDDIADSLPDEDQPGYFELLIESIGF
jgi:outer membrane protein assembly factor BamE